MFDAAEEKKTHNFSDGKYTTSYVFVGEIFQRNGKLKRKNLTESNVLGLDWHF